MASAPHTRKVADCSPSSRQLSAGSVFTEIQEGLRYVFQTKSKYVLLVAGSGHAGMEAAIANLLEPGETIVVGNKGVWGQRVNDMSERYGGKIPLVAWSVHQGGGLQFL